MSHRFVTFIGAAALALSPAFAFAGEDAGSVKQIEELAIEMASTPAEHEALADYYRQKAAEARAEATKHEHMRHGYGLSKSGRSATYSAHCERLVKLYDDEAAEYDALAAMHDEEAKKAAAE